MGDGPTKDALPTEQFPNTEIPDKLKGIFVGGFLPYTIYRDRTHIQAWDFWKQHAALAAAQGLTFMTAEVNGTVERPGASDLVGTDHRTALFVSGQGAEEFYKKFLDDAAAFINTLPK